MAKRDSLSVRFAAVLCPLRANKGAPLGGACFSEGRNVSSESSYTTATYPPGGNFLSPTSTIFRPAVRRSIGGSGICFSICVIPPAIQRGIRGWIGVGPVPARSLPLSGRNPAGAQARARHCAQTGIISKQRDVGIRPAWPEFLLIPDCCRCANRQQSVIRIVAVFRQKKAASQSITSSTAMGVENTGCEFKLTFAHEGHPVLLAGRVNIFRRAPVFRGHHPWLRTGAR